MKLSAVSNSINFTRALRNDEIEEYQNTIEEASKQLGHKEVSATIFDFNNPRGKYDTGIGTSFSAQALDVAKFLHTNGFSAIQLQPQGEISNMVRSPYSGTSFSLGSHLIDLEKLTTANYEGILSKDDLENSTFIQKKKPNDIVDYDSVFDSENGQDSILRVAYHNFLDLDKNSKLKKDFENFKKDPENSYWLERDSLFEAAAIDNGSHDSEQWQKKDKYLFGDEKNIDKRRIQELKDVVDDDGDNVVDFNEFKQFIADKQQKDSKANYHKLGMKIYGDCQIGFSQKDIWAHRSAFYDNGEGRMFGCAIGGGKYTCWSPAINFEDLDGEAGRLLQQKFSTFFNRYDGVRIDAAWQLVNPTIAYKTGEVDKDGNSLGSVRHVYQPEVGDKIMKIITKEADKHQVPRNRIKLEMLDGDGKGFKAVEGLGRNLRGANLIQITRYMGNGWGRPAIYKSDSVGAFKQPFEISPGTHDDIKAREQARGFGEEQIDCLAKDLKISHSKLQTTTQKQDAIYGLCYTNDRLALTSADIFNTQAINTPNTQQGNWENRLSSNWKADYYEQVKLGKALNPADAYSKALKAVNGENDTTKKLDYWAGVLRE